MYSPKRKIIEDGYLTTYIMSIHDVCEEIFKDTLTGRRILREIKMYRYSDIYKLLVFNKLDTETNEPTKVDIQILGDYSYRNILTKRKFRRYCTAFDIMKDIDQLKMTMNLLDDKSLDFLG